MRTPALAALSLAIPLVAGGGAPAVAGGWWDCDRPAYYSAPVRSYRHSYYAPARPYYYRYAYGPRIVGYGPGPAYRYRRPSGYYSAYSYYSWGGWGPRGVAIGIGF